MGWFRDTVPVDWAQNYEYHGIVRLCRDLIRVRLNSVWQGYSDDFQDHPSTDVGVDAGEYDGFPSMLTRSQMIFPVQTIRCKLCIRGYSLAR
jgi:hypothetical protein